MICGVSGQDGAYLADFLLKKGYKVFGTSRDIQNGLFENLKKLNIFHRVTLLSMEPQDFKSTFDAIAQSNPDEIYFLAGHSSVSFSFESPVISLQSIVVGALNVLEVCKTFKKNIKFYYAGSGDSYGDTMGARANEITPFQPRSPYGISKAAGYWLVKNYREAYGLFACTGILFNHESNLRPEHFVTQKIISHAKRNLNGSKEKLFLGRLDIYRDWGWAPEYVEAMWLMLQQESPEDYVIATGVSLSLQHFVEHAFSLLSLDWRDYVECDNSFFRPTEIFLSEADPTKAKIQLAWEAKTKGVAVIRKLVDEQANF